MMVDRIEETGNPRLEKDMKLYSDETYEKVSVLERYRYYSTDEPHGGHSDERGR